MFVPRLRTTALALTATLGLSACAYDGYGYGGLSVGYGSSYYGNGYYSPYYGTGYGYGGYGSGYGYPYGWNNGFYYPGTGFYVYDRYNRRHRWSQSQQRYWQQRHSQWQQRNRSGNRQVVVQQRRDGSRVVVQQRRDGSRAVRRSDRRDQER